MGTRTRFSERRKVAVNFGDEPTRTKQSMKDECDINNIMRKFIRNGTVTHLNEKGARYGFVPAIDYREAMDTVLEGQRVFEGLPAKVRKRFDNDPAEFLAFVQDPANLQEMRELGLARAEVPAPVDPAPPVDPPN